MSVGTTRQLECAICRAPVPARDDNPAFPFCSAQCQLIDLGRWLDGDYRVPAPATPEDADFMAAEFPGSDSTED